MQLIVGYVINTRTRTRSLKIHLNLEPQARRRFDTRRADDKRSRGRARNCLGGIRPMFCVKCSGRSRQAEQQSEYRKRRYHRIDPIQGATVARQKGSRVFDTEMTL